MAGSLGDRPGNIVRQVLQSFRQARQQNKCRTPELLFIVAERAASESGDNNETSEQSCFFDAALKSASPLSPLTRNYATLDFALRPGDD